MLIPGAKRLTTLDKTGFRTADGLSVEMKGMCTGSVMKRESGVPAFLRVPLNEPMEIKSACDSSLRLIPRGDSDHRYEYTLIRLCFIRRKEWFSQSQTILLGFNKKATSPWERYYRANSEIQQWYQHLCWL